MTSTPTQQSPLSDPLLQNIGWSYQYRFWEEGIYYRSVKPLFFHSHERIVQSGPASPDASLSLPTGSYFRCVSKTERPLTVPTDKELINVFVEVDALTPAEQVVRVGFFPGVRGDARAFERIENELLILAIAAKGLA